MPIYEQAVYRPEQAAKFLGLGRSKVWELLQSGRLRSYKIDAARVIAAEELQRFLDECKKESDN
jgi:excisionase family DNA binding protein